MNSDSSTENDNKEYIWAQGKSASHLTSSESDMNDQRKEIIRQSLEFNIIDIRTFTGYKGDLLVEITSMRTDVILSLKKIAETLGFETVVQKDIISVYKLFCISPASHTYDLK